MKWHSILTCEGTVRVSALLNNTLLIWRIHQTFEWVSLLTRSHYITDSLLEKSMLYPVLFCKLLFVVNFITVFQFLLNSSQMYALSTQTFLWEWSPWVHWRSGAAFAFFTDKDSLGSSTVRPRTHPAGSSAVAYTPKQFSIKQIFIFC